MDPNNNKKIQRDAPARQAVDSTTSWRFAEAPDPIEFAQTVLGVADVGVLRDGDGRITRAWVDHVEVDRRELQRIARARVAEAERLGDPRVAPWRVQRALARVDWPLISRPIVRPYRPTRRAPRRARRARRIARVNRAGPDEGPPRRTPVLATVREGDVAWPGKSPVTAPARIRPCKRSRRTLLATIDHLSSKVRRRGRAGGVIDIAARSRHGGDA